MKHSILLAVVSAILIEGCFCAYPRANAEPGIGRPITDEKPGTNNSTIAKTTVSILLISANSDDSGVFEEFRQLFPFARKGAGFRLDLPPEDPRVNQVLAEFARRGIPSARYEGPTKKNRPRFEYMVDYHHHYEPADFGSARYLYLQHEVLISDDQRRDEQGHLLLPSVRLSPNLQIGCVLFEATVVSDTLRREMIQAGLIGPQFIEVVPVGQDTEERFWEMKSSVTLPPMPRDRIKRHQASPEDDVHVAGILDGDYLEKEIHYAEDALRKIEPFDVAETHEIFCGPGWKKDRNGERRLVVSQRFRQFCLERHLKVSWHSPVRIDPAAQDSVR